MCGIAGFNWKNPGLIRVMMERLRHRGPDDEGVFEGERASMAHTRLSVIDLSAGGHQPMTFGPHTIAYNGEIYNFKELRRELEEKQHHFVSDSDTEVLLHAYAQWGEGCLSKFNGMFAFAIYDRKKNEWFLARDRLGIKPLYYCRTQEAFIFASELSALTAACEDIDFDAVNAYFTFRFTPGDQTLFKGVKRLPPGHFMRFDGREAEMKCYWAACCESNGKRIEDNADKLIDLLTQSLKRRLVSDVPLGIFLSGGLDSSFLVGLTAKLSGKPPDVFHARFSMDPNDESARAKLVADRYGAKFHQIDVDVDAVGILPEVTRHLGEPIGDAATIPTYLMSKETKKFVTVILSGEGADELFAGYPKYKILSLARNFPSLPRIFRDGLCGRVSGLMEANPWRKYLNLVSVFSGEEKKKLFRFDFNEPPAAPAAFPGDLSLANLLMFDIRTWLPNDLLHKIDSMTMAHALEARVPFLDHELVEFALTIPPDQKLRLWREKVILRFAAQGILPDKILQRKKQGFTLPAGLWMKRGLSAYAFALIEECGVDFLDKKYMRFIIAEGGKNIFSRRKFWTLLFFMEWHRQKING